MCVKCLPSRLGPNVLNIISFKLLQYKPVCGICAAIYSCLCQFQDVSSPNKQRANEINFSLSKTLFNETIYIFVSKTHLNWINNIH